LYRQKEPKTSLAAVICPAIGLRLTVIKVIGMSGKPTFMAYQADNGQSLFGQIPEADWKAGQALIVRHN
jgi:hypothetical protein